MRHSIQEGRRTFHRISVVGKIVLALLLMCVALIGLPQAALADDGGFEVNGTAVTLGTDETWASRFVTAVKDSNTTSIKLTADLQIPDTVDYFELAGTNVSIDLNGHTLSMAGDSRIVVNSGHKLTLEDKAEDGSKGQLVGTSRTNREVIEYNGGDLTLEGLTASSAGQPLVKMGTGAGTLTISGCTIKDSSTGTQSVITALGGTVNVTNSTFSGNTATNGGALYANGSTTVNINQGTTFTNNTATNEGGAIKAENGVTVNINGGTISNNTAVSNGGGVLVWNGNLTMTDGAIITGNTSGSEGGGIYFGGNDQAYTLTISGGTISSNTATSEAWGTGGGGVCARGGNNKFNLSGGTITGNFAQGSGGGILNATDFFHMTGGSVTNNTADLHEGGGITLTGTEGLDTNTALIEAGTITGNKTGYKADGTIDSAYQDWGGGGIFVSDKATLMVPNDTQVTGNDALGFGGGIAGCSTARIYILDNTAVYGNTAKGTNASGAGSVKQEDHKYALDNETFMANGYQDIFSAFSAYVTQAMPGGTENWSGSVDGQVLKSGTDPIVSSSALGLTAGNTSSNTSWQLVVNNNSSATHGGGILINGTAMFGNSKEITIGASVEFNAIKDLLDADGNDLSSALVTIADDGTQTGHATFAISTSADKTDTSAIFSTGEVKKVVDDSSKAVSYQILFDRRPTFDNRNCTGAGPWTFTYYIYETGADSWMNADGTMYEVVLTVKKLSESQRIGVEDANTHNFTKYRYDIDWSQSTVSKSTDGGTTWTALTNGTDYGYWERDEAHSDQLYLYKDATDTTAAVNTFTNTLKETATVTVTKVWKDGNDADGLRPNAQTFAASLHLYADGQLVEGATPTVTKKSDGSYTVTYTGLPYSTVTTADDGTITVTPITYRVVEDLGQGNAYTVSYTNTGDYASMTDGAYDGGTITNTHTPAVKTTSTAKPSTARLPKTSDPFSDLAALTSLLAGMGCGTTGVGLTLRRRNRRR